MKLYGFPIFTLLIYYICNFLKTNRNNIVRMVAIRNIFSKSGQNPERNFPIYLYNKLVIAMILKIDLLQKSISE